MCVYPAAGGAAPQNLPQRPVHHWCPQRLDLLILSELQPSSPLPIQRPAPPPLQTTPPEQMSPAAAASIQRTVGRGVTHPSYWGLQSLPPILELSLFWGLLLMGVRGLRMPLLSLFLMGVQGPYWPLVHLLLMGVRGPRWPLLHLLRALWLIRGMHLLLPHRFWWRTEDKKFRGLLMPSLKT